MRPAPPAASPQVPHGLFLGLATLDVIQYTQRPPGPDEKVTSEQAALAAGGPATGAAIAFAALGGSAALITRLGADAPGNLVRADLAQSGVNLVAVPGDEAVSTPVSSITVSTATAQRSIVGTDAARTAPRTGTTTAARTAAATTAATNTPTTTPTTTPAALALIATAVTGAHVLLLDGHHPDLALAAAHKARDTGVPTVVDVGRWKPVFGDLAALADHLVCSEAVRFPGTHSERESVAALHRAGCRTVVVTRGPGPVLLSERSRAGQIRTQEIPVPPVAAVDTLGAGDTFHGGYAHAIATGADPSDAVLAAITTAGERVQHRGPREWLTAARRPGAAR